MFTPKLSFSSPLVKFLCLFVNDGRNFYFCYLGYGNEKHKSYKNLVSIFIHGGLILKIQFYKGSRYEKQNDTKKNK
jgi:hypothetical protein